MNLAGIYGITGCSTINDQFLQFGRSASVYLTTTSTQATHNYTTQWSSDTTRLLLLRGVQYQCSCWTMSTTLCLWFPFAECHIQSLENAATSLSLQSLSFAHALFKIKPYFCHPFQLRECLSLSCCRLCHIYELENGLHNTNNWRYPLLHLPFSVLMTWLMFGLYAMEALKVLKLIFIFDFHFIWSLWCVITTVPCVSVKADRLTSCKTVAYKKKILW